MTHEPITLLSIIKFIGAPIIAIIGFFAKKVMNDMSTRLDKLEVKQEKNLTKKQGRQLIKDLLAPIEVSHADIKHAVEEVEKCLHEIKRKL